MLSFCISGVRHQNLSRCGASLEQDSLRAASICLWWKKSTDIFPAFELISGFLHAPYSPALGIDPQYSTYQSVGQVSVDQKFSSRFAAFPQTAASLRSSVTAPWSRTCMEIARATTMPFGSLTRTNKASLKRFDLQ